MGPGQPLKNPQAAQSSIVALGAHRGALTGVGRRGEGAPRHREPALQHGWREGFPQKVGVKCSPRNQLLRPRVETLLWGSLEDST